MSTKVQGETTAANVIQQTPIKSKNSEQTDNVPTKQFLAKIQALTGEIKEKQQDVEKESEKFLELVNSKDLDDSDLKHLARITNSLKKQVEELSEKMNEVHAVVATFTNVQGPSDDPKGPSIIVTFGYVGEAERALNELQVQLNKLQQLQRAVNKAILDSQRGGDTVDAHGNTVHHTGTIAAMAKAANASANADAFNKYLDMGKDIALGAVSVASIALSAKQYKDFKNETLDGPDGSNTRLTNAKAFQDELTNTKPGQGGLTNQPDGNASDDDEGLPELDEEQEKLKRDLVEGVGPYKAGTDEDVLKHIVTDDEARVQTRKNVLKEIHNAELQRNSDVTTHQSNVQTLNMGFDAGKQAITAGATGLQAWLGDSSKKGPAEATRQLTQYANEQQSQAVGAGSQVAQAIDQQALQINQAKEKANSQSQ